MIQDLNHSIKQQVYLYQVWLSNYQSINKLDVPFINGEFNTEGAFMNVNVDDIKCDESIVVNE